MQSLNLIRDYTRHSTLLLFRPPHYRLFKGFDLHSDVELPCLWLYYALPLYNYTILP